MKSLEIFIGKNVRKFFKALLHLFLRFRLSILDFYQFEQKMCYEALIWQFSVAIEKLENESQHFHQLFFGQYKQKNDLKIVPY